MQRVLRRLCLGVLLASAFAQISFAQRALTWQEVRDRFHATNPTLSCGTNWSRRISRTGDHRIPPPQSQPDDYC